MSHKGLSHGLIIFAVEVKWNYTLISSGSARKLRTTILIKWSLLTYWYQSVMEINKRRDGAEMLTFMLCWLRSVCESLNLHQKPQHQMLKRKKRSRSSAVSLKSEWSRTLVVVFIVSSESSRELLLILFCHQKPRFGHQHSLAFHLFFPVLF